MKKILALALFIISCHSIPPAHINNTRAEVLPIMNAMIAAKAASSTVSPCFLSGTCPEYVPYCGECYMGKGSRVDWSCVDEAKEAWDGCEEQACTRRNTRITRATNKRDLALQVATDELFGCLEMAQTEADQDHCYQIAQAAVDAAWLAYNNALSLADVIYSSDVLTCDFIYDNEVSDCCTICKPWEGWIEDD